MRFNLTSVITLVVALFVLRGTLSAQVLPVDSAKQSFQDSVRARIIASPLDAAKEAAPKPDEKKNTLNISVDMRVRSEIRHGYKVIPKEDTSAAFFINQRTRLNFDFKTRRFDFWASLQDTRVWGQQDPREGQGTPTPTDSTTYPLYLFEIYAEPHFNDKWSIRIGRQRIIYDNQRLFAENDWRLPANSHDAVRLIYNNKINFTTEFIAAYNQYGENNFTTNYKTAGFTNYKNLFVNYLNWKMSNNFTLTTINTADGYQSSKVATKTFERYTSGGRIEYASYSWYLTFSGYYQYGKDSTGKKLGAYYYQPEIRYTGMRNVTFRLGMEYMSGQDSSLHLAKNKSFVPLYGVAHRFMGAMDVFDTPSDFNNAGIINPYFFIWWAKGKWAWRFDQHLFYSQARFLNKGEQLDRYLGYEFDVRMNYKPVPYIDIESGISWASFTKAATVIKKGGDTKAIPYWYYLSVRFTPTLLKFSF